MQKQSVYLSAAMVVLMVRGCALGPVESAEMNGNGTISFWGYAVEPGAEVRMETFVPLLNRWMPVQTINGADHPPVYASERPTLPQWGSPLYEWHASPKIPPLAFVFSGEARVRVTINGEPAVLYDQAGYDCVMANAGPPPANVIANGYNCSAATNGGAPRHEVTIRQPSPRR